MKLNLSVDECLSTTRAVRQRLDITKPVPRALIEECLELALQAPNGINQNTWRWIVVDDRDKVAKLGALYKAVVDQYSAQLTANVAHHPGEDKVIDTAKEFPNKVG